MFTDYLLLISPSEKITTDVQAFKKLLADKIGEYESLNSVPHLTLASFAFDDTKESYLVSSLQRAAEEEKPFIITLNGFDIFRQSRTIFVKAGNENNFASLSKNLHEKSLIFKTKQSKTIIKKPHMTVGKKLTTDFNEAWSLFSQTKYTESFEVHSVVLLKRNSSKKYDKVADLPFLSKGPKQLSLFRSF